MLGVSLKDIKIGKINCGAYCKRCKKQNIFYAILNGRYVYYCLHCKVWLDISIMNCEVSGYKNF